jgi:hypothetical protein
VSDSKVAEFDSNPWEFDSKVAEFTLKSAPIRILIQERTASPYGEQRAPLSFG